MLKDEPFAENVLVVWCATRPKPQNGTTVVGWYKNACVWRKTQKWSLDNNGIKEERLYNVRADANNCVLLPVEERNGFEWRIPSARGGSGNGFGQSMVWYPEDSDNNAVTMKVINAIKMYRGENWLNNYPEI